jgi:hypothetical protein
MLTSQFFHFLGAELVSISLGNFIKRHQSELYSTAMKMRMNPVPQACQRKPLLRS